MRKIRCLIFVDVDVVVRHFLHNKTFELISKKHFTKFIFPEKKNKRFGNVVDVSKLELHAKYERCPQHNKRAFIWKQLFQIDAVKFKFDKKTRGIRKSRRSTLGWKATLIYLILGLPIIWSVFRYLRFFQLKYLKNYNLNNIIDDFKPDVIIHPSVLEGTYINDLIYFSKKKNIPLLVIMNSWDNPSTKRAMVGNPDWLLVWGEQTKNHAISLMKMSKEKVLIFGSAQFDIFLKKPTLSKHFFLKKYKISKNQKIILYAGSSKFTDEIRHLTMIENFIDNNELSNIKILYRPHPWGSGGKNGDKILKKNWKYVMFDLNMIKYLENVKIRKSLKILPSYIDTHNILSNVDAVITPLSTILIEAALHGKPALCFIPYEDNSRHLNSNASLLHFQEVFTSEFILTCFGYDDLKKSVIRLIEMTYEKNIDKKIKKEATYFVKSFKESYPKRLLNFIEKTF